MKEGQVGMRQKEDAFGGLLVSPSESNKINFHLNAVLWLYYMVVGQNNMK